MKTKLLPQTFEFETDERNLLVAELKMSMIDPKNYPMTVERKEMALRANKEDHQLKNYLNHIDAKIDQEHLTDLCKVKNVANDLKNQHDETDPLEAMLIDQMAAIHKAGMGMLSTIYDMEEGISLEVCEKYVNLANKLMKTYQSGFQALTQAKNAGKQTIVVKHQNVQVNGGQAIVASEINTGDGGKV